MCPYLLGWRNCYTFPWWGHSLCTAVKFGDHKWLRTLLLLRKFKEGPQNIFKVTQLHDYKARLRKLGIVPLMYFLDYQDIIFLVSCLKETDSNSPVLNYISFSSSNARSSTFLKLTTHKVKSNPSRHFYFNRVTRLWNFLPPIDLNLFLPTIKKNLKQTFWKYVEERFNSSDHCSFNLVCPCNRCRVIPSYSSFNQAAAST